MQNQPNGDIEFSWIRRGRIDADGWHMEDIPLGEDYEAYRIEIWQDGVLIRQQQVPETRWLYDGAQRIAELSTAPFLFRVAMLSSRIGPGDFAVLEAF